jgi:hypothetical protein
MRIRTRDPIAATRDPEMEQPEPRKPRHYIPASMPTVCPDCGANTRMSDGRHVDPVRQTILEYRTCIRCKKKLAAGRKMSRYEVETLCTMAEAVREYENDVR